MIVRVVESKFTRTETISRDAVRALAVVKPTWAYSGSVKLPVGTPRNFGPSA
jgi:hypothetical protein